MTHNKIHLMDLAKKCESKPEPKPPELSRDDTLLRIGELKAEISLLYEEREDILTILNPIQKLIENLCDEKWALEATIVKVQRVNLKTVREPKPKDPLREELLDALLKLSPEQVAELKKGGGQ